MRADRLIAVLLLLQTRGRVTVAEVARELEVSSRTARRDLEALGMAGVPVYSSAGRGGGWSLVGGARTDLSGLTVDEARALFLAAGPATGGTPGVQAALRKLLAALPAPLRKGAEAAGSAVVVDPATWGRTPPPEPQHLGVLRQAVLDARQVVLGYTGRAGPPSSRTVSPLGLVTKSGVWYLVAGTDAGVRTFRVGRVTGGDADRCGRGPAGGLRPGRGLGGELGRGRGAPGTGAGAGAGRPAWCRCCGSGWAPG